MDVEYPYADGLSRRQLLYRLPLTPQPRRLLLVCDDAGSQRLGDGWGSAVTRMSASATAAVSGGNFDAVALPDQPPEQIQALLQMAHRRLVPGGVVIGHFENPLALRRLGTLNGWAGLARSLMPGAIRSAAGCKAALARAGFQDAACFFVQPNMDSPMGLIPCEQLAARAQFLRSIRSAQGHHGRVAYAARVALAMAGLGGLQQPQLFFWAGKAC